MLWKKRQKMINDAASKIHNTASAMQNATRDLMGNISTAEEKVGILLAVNSLVRQIDNANDFKTVGGLAVTTGLLDDESRDVRLHAAWVIGTASRNVATVQEAALELGVVDRLVNLLKVEQDVGAAKKMVLALNAVVQGPDAAIVRLTELGGQDVLAHWLLIQQTDGAEKYIMSRLLSFVHCNRRFDHLRQIYQHFVEPELRTCF